MEISEEGKAEIAAAVKILKEDGLHISKTYQKVTAAPAKEEESTEGKPPPAKKTEEKTAPVKPGLWWGTRT